MSEPLPKEAIEAAIKAGLDATDGEWRSDRKKREVAIRTALARLGFTREDVRLLRQHAKLCEFWEQTDNVKEATTRTYSLADHIEALLPTEEKSPAPTVELSLS